MTRRVQSLHLDALADGKRLLMRWRSRDLRTVLAADDGDVVVLELDVAEHQ